MSKVHTLARLLGRLNRMISERPDEVRRGIDRAGQAVDRRTGGRYRSQIQRGTRAASRYVERRGRRR